MKKSIVTFAFAFVAAFTSVNPANAAATTVATGSDNTVAVALGTGGVWKNGGFKTVALETGGHKTDVAVALETGGVWKNGGRKTFDVALQDASHKGPWTDNPDDWANHD